MATPLRKIKKLTAHQLRRMREDIYKKHVMPRPRGLFTGVDGERFQIPAPGARAKNFNAFVAANFVQGFEPGSWPDVVTGLPVYQKLKDYSNTEYGAAMIFRVLQDNNNKSTQHFQVRYDDGAAGEKAQAGFNFILLSKGFPDTTPFKGGEKKYPLSIIHHEFGHTRFFSSHPGPVTVTHPHERLAVIHNDNPVRMLNSHEPRYTYYKNGKTINIITGATSTSLHTVLENDPRVLVKIGSAGAYRK